MGNEKGFSYLDLILAITIMMIGVLASVSAITTALIRVYETEQQAIAKQMALSALEGIFATRDLGRRGTSGTIGINGWDLIRNASQPPVNGVQGIFLDGWRPVRQSPGADGIPGTADDACDAPGPCGTGSNQNTSPIIGGFERMIQITDLEDPDRPSSVYGVTRRRIDISVRYSVRGIPRQQTVSTIVTNY
ncbi:MAG: hypothetical protein D6687_07295 [Acidobacteria bacterium]|jgi:type II secretory pathway pseudopilin PulG|nr:MAG: hypothetical protein D6687_07295 [Acidobacteriota bacterium]GIU81688.1 MAG: hypothetical protein KatS3mg006_0752 [Pyrinomonadaceae bacterium]